MHLAGAGLCHRTLPRALDRVSGLALVSRQSNADGRFSDGRIQPPEEYGCRCGTQQLHSDEPGSIVGSNSRECVAEGSRYGNCRIGERR
jgi:hypothetical protein